MQLLNSDICDIRIKQNNTETELLRIIRGYQDWKNCTLEKAEIAQRKYNELIGVSVDMADVHEMD